MTEKLPVGTELVCVSESEVLFKSDMETKKGIPCKVTEGMQGIVCGHHHGAQGDWISVSLPLYEIAVQIPAKTFKFIWAVVP